MRQGRLFDEKTIEQRFEEFLRVYPDVYPLFKRFSYQLLYRGQKRYGAKAIVERIRWHYATSTTGGPEFKMNNNFTSRLARRLIDEDGRFAEMFETRRLRSE